MLYLRRSQINVPRDRRQGNSSRPQVAAEGLIENTKRGVFEKARHCKQDYDFTIYKTLD
jgi:hypothetical protein